MSTGKCSIFFWAHSTFFLPLSRDSTATSNYIKLMKHLNQIHKLLSHYVFLMNHLLSSHSVLRLNIRCHWQCTNISSFNTIISRLQLSCLQCTDTFLTKLASHIQAKNHGIWYFDYPYSNLECFKSFCLSNNGCLRPINCFMALSGLSINHSRFVNSLSSAMRKRNKSYFYLALSNHHHAN